MPPAVEAPSPNHWTASDFPEHLFIFFWILIGIKAKEHSFMSTLNTNVSGIFVKNHFGKSVETCEKGQVKAA